MTAVYISTTRAERLSRTCPSHPRRAFGSLPKALYTLIYVVKHHVKGCFVAAHDVVFGCRRTWNVCVPEASSPSALWPAGSLPWASNPWSASTAASRCVARMSASLVCWPWKANRSIPDCNPGAEHNRSQSPGLLVKLPILRVVPQPVE